MKPGEISSRFDKFVGRERELSELSHALDEICEGHGRLFLISGEPGIGKTRLAEEVTDSGLHQLGGFSSTPRRARIRTRIIET
jgi:Cdc6-like AAA superfamily ATPase